MSSIVVVVFMCVLHVCGDDPASLINGYGVTKCSPRMWR